MVIPWPRGYLSRETARWGGYARARPGRGRLPGGDPGRVGARAGLGRGPARGRRRSAHDGAAFAAGRPQGALDEGPEPLGQLAARLAERRELLLVRSFDLRRILEVPVDRFVGAGEDWAALPGAVAHGDHVVELPVEELGHGLAPGRRPVDADLREDPDR